MSLISVNNLTFAYDGSYDTVFDGVSFQIDTDWRLGFIGRNGRGKTTFLKLLCGEYEYGGSISAPVGFEYFPYEVADKTQNTLEVVAAVCPDYKRWELLRELSGLEVFEDVLYRPFCTLSNGEQTKTLLAVLFLKENSFLLIDEPTNHLDMAARAIVSRYLNSKKGFILVSHDRAFLDGCVDHVLSINKTNIEVQSGNFSSWLLNKERRDGFEAAENEKLEREVARLEKAAAEKSAWSDRVEATKYATKNSGLRPDRGYIGHKSAKLMKRAKSLENRQKAAIKEKSGLLKDVERSDAIKIWQLSYHSKRLAQLSDVSVFYGDKTACQGVSFTVEQGDRISLAGKNGSGKSSVLKLMRGEALSYTGELKTGSGLIISYVPQDSSFLCGGLSDYAAQNRIDESLFKAILRKLDFSRAQFDKDMRDYSAGQKKKVLIAASLCERAHLHLWDEPLNYIDVISRMQIEELLLQFKPTIVFVEHDSVFCEKIATKTVRL